MYGVNHFSFQLKVQRSGLRGAEISFNLGKTSIEKKRFLSGMARITYPPPDPNSDVKI